MYATSSNEVTAARRNDYYFRDWDPDPDSTASDYPEINVKEGTTVSATKNAWIPGANESPTYDANGNLTEDALWNYTYDEENRLIRMTETPAATTAGFPDTEITFKYDYLGRRVEKKVMRGTTTETHLRFVWRGWLLVAELDAASNDTLIKTYTWGPDISGSFGGAGGNGGVLIFKDHTSTVNESFYPAYDAQGNVTGLIDTAGNLDAAYEYDPFGKLIRYAGARRASMSLLYSTKYTDMESGLIYYGHRYYDPRQGRFINRDPIGEAGGINLYGFVGNSPTNRVDYLGLEYIPLCDPDSDEYDEDACDQLAQSSILLKTFEVKGSLARALNVFGPFGIEYINDYLDEFKYDDDYSGGNNSPGKSNLQPWPLGVWEGVKNLSNRVYKTLTTWHFEKREARNTPTVTYSQIKPEELEGLRKMTPWESRYHDNKIGSPEVKLVHRDGREFVYSRDYSETGEYELYTDPRYMGTFNYIPPAPLGDGWTDVYGWSIWVLSGTGHLFVDVLPYKVGGNVRGPDDAYEEEDNNDDDND